MKVLNIETGGHLNSNDDLIHLQSAFQEGFEALFKMLLQNPGNSHKLFGCDLTVDASNASTTEGVIFYQNEFFLVDAHSIPVVESGALGWKIEEVFDSNNPVVYASGASVRPHITRKMLLVYDTYDVEESALTLFNLKHLTPDHEWDGTQLRFENTDGTWGDFVDLKGEQGEQGLQGEQGIQGIQGLPGADGSDSNLSYGGVVSNEEFQSEIPKRWFVLNYDDGTNTETLYIELGQLSG